MLMVSILERSIWSEKKGHHIDERKFVLHCPKCQKLLSFRVHGKIERSFSRFTDRCNNCGNIRPDVERIVDQNHMRISYIFSKTDRVY